MSLEAERTTRKLRIDPRLTRAGWHIEQFRPELSASDYAKAAVEEYETANGPADYGLCDGGQVRGVVEAKKVTLGPQGVLTQAERYSKGLHQVPMYQGEFGAPFLYSNNGEVIWRHPDG
jgi:type I restriction enzyme R subunit